MENKMEDLKEQILAAMNRNADLDELWQILLAFKNLGGLQEFAYQTLDEMRPLGDEKFEDTIMDLMDYVSGWCVPRLRIWDTYLKT
jgi:hypothetical protein